jgi:hypothetical protein
VLFSVARTPIENTARLSRSSRHRAKEGSMEVVIGIVVAIIVVAGLVGTIGMKGPDA